MSSDAADGTTPPKAPAGEPPAAGAASAAPEGTAPAPAEAAAGDSPVADPVVSGAAVTEAAPAGAPSPDIAADLPADLAADLAAADAKAMTIVLDPQPADDELYGEEPYGEERAAEPVSKLAIIALVAGILALVPIAVACGIGALIGIRRSGRRGHGMAMAALFASAAWLIMGGAVGAVGVLTHGFHKPVTIKYKEAAVFKLQVGDCVDSPNGQLVSVLPCATPHEAEVFATFSLPGSAWPGTSAVAQEASSGCASRLAGYLNPQLAISLAQAYVYPDRVAWTAGTHTVICEVRATSGLLTGSVRGAT